MIGSALDVGNADSLRIASRVECKAGPGTAAPVGLTVINSMRPVPRIHPVKFSARVKLADRLPTFV